MERAVLDSSALLAAYQNERGSDVVLPLLPDALMSAVNAAEVQEVLIRKGALPSHAWRQVLSGLANIEAFDAQQAKICGELAASTARAGLSAGDRACLALAITMGLPVYTADRAWAKVNVGCVIHLIR